jgi:hypothetical protein
MNVSSGQALNPPHGRGKFRDHYFLNLFRDQRTRKGKGDSVPNKTHLVEPQ